ncbi:MAG: hybrid sensor histidine kinase/response regulator [Spartobacteria bacterium]|nr:hybrid sensor histidine kinase/response regulator [Spartobacteria bacterium]
MSGNDAHTWESPQYDENPHRQIDELREEIDRLSHDVYQLERSYVAEVSKAKRRDRYLFFIHQLLRDITVTRNVTAILNRVVQELAGNIGFDRSIIYKKRGESYFPIASFGYGDAQDDQLLVDPFFVDTVEKQKGMLVNRTNYEMHKGSYEAVLQVLYFLAAPIPVHDEIAYILFAGNESEGSIRRQRLSVSELNTLQVIGSQIGIAIENSELYRELEIKVEERTRQLDEARREAENGRKLAEKANRVKGAFLANVSHEIRTPLNGIMGFAELMLGASTPERMQEYAGIVLRESEGLLELINDILDEAKIEAGKLELYHQPMDIEQLVQRLISVNQVRAEQKNLSLNIYVSDNVPRFIMADSLRLRQILQNLISNAIKFTSTGSVTVEAEVLSTIPHMPMLRFSVIDTGIGIPEDRQTHIFESYTQAEHTTAEKYGGTGLGTTIATQLVHMFGGDIGLRSKENEGSVFWFTIPLIECKPSDYAAPAETVCGWKPATVYAPGGRLILVAEDYPTNRRLAVKHLEDAGYNVLQAGNGREAVEICNTERVDLVLMDVQMPVMDGYEASRAIRAGVSPRAKAPIIGLTAYADSNTRYACQAAGMNDVLVKPLKKRQMLETVRKWMPGGDVPQPFVSSPQEHVAQIPLSEPVDLQEAIQEYESRQLYEEEIGLFISHLEARIPEMRAALLDEEFDNLGTICHQISGAAATLRAKPLAQVAQTIEKLIHDNELDEIPILVDKMMYTITQLRRYVYTLLAK